MKKTVIILWVSLMMAACKTKTDPASEMANGGSAGGPEAKDTLTYLFKATYSSDITAPSHPGNAQKVLQVWKMFETNQIQAMKPYFADSVKYDDASGMHFNGKSAELLAYAEKDIANLDSLRFDISMWQSAHINDKNEDWVNIWSSERRYPKKGRPDTMLIQENWKLKDGKIVYFNQYTSKN